MPTPARRPVTTAALLTAALALPAAPGATAQTLEAALDLAPAGAEVIIAVPSIDDVDAAINTFSQAAALPMPPGAAPSDLMFQEIGLQGVDTARGGVMVLTGLSDAIRDNTEPEFLLLVPAADYDALAAGVRAEPADADGIAATTMGTGASGFIRRVEAGGNTYAALGETREAVAGANPASAGAAMLDRLSAFATQNADDDAATVFIDLAAFRPQLLEALPELREELIADMRDDAAVDGLPVRIDEAVLVDVLINGLQTVIEGAEAVTFAVDADEAGLGIDMALRMVDNSALAGFIGAPSVSPAELLNSLPGGSFLISTYTDNTALDWAQVAPSLDRVLGAFTPADANAEQLAPLLQLIRTTADEATGLIAATQAYAAAYYPPSAGFGAGGFYDSLTVSRAKDAGEARARFRGTMTAVSDLFTRIGGLSPDDFGMGGNAVEEIQVDGLDDAAAAPPAPAGNDIGAPDTLPFTFTFSPNDLQIAGREVDYFRFDPGVQPDMAGNPMAFMAGPTVTEGYLAVTGNTLVATGSADAELLKRGLAAVDDDGGLGDSAVIAGVAEQGVDQPIYASYVSVSGIAEMAAPLAGMFLQMQIDPPADLPAISTVLGSDGSALAGRAFIPASVVRFGSEVANQAMAGFGNVPQDDFGGGFGDDGFDDDFNEPGPPPAPF